MGYLLIAISLVVAIVGLFSSTVETREEEGKPKVRRVTRWGYMVAALLVISAVANGFNAHVTAKNQKKKDEESRQALSQQRLLALAALGTAYTLAGKPFVAISYTHSIDMGKHPEKYEAFCEKHREFPGAGFPVKGYMLSLEPTGEDSFYFATGKTPEAETTAGIDNTMQYSMELTPEDVNHTWLIPGYETLDDLLFDFKSESKIGTLTFWRTTGNFTSSEVANLHAMINDEIDQLHVRCFLGKKGKDLGRVHLKIPVGATQPQLESGKLSFALIAEDPVIDSIPFTPF